MSMVDVAPSFGSEVPAVDVPKDVESNARVLARILTGKGVPGNTHPERAIRDHMVSIAKVCFDLIPDKHRADTVASVVINQSIDSIVAGSGKKQKVGKKRVLEDIKAHSKEPFFNAKDVKTLSDVPDWWIWAVLQRECTVHEVTEEMIAKIMLKSNKLRRFALWYMTCLSDDFVITTPMLEKEVLNFVLTRCMVRRGNLINKLGGLFVHLCDDSVRTKFSHGHGVFELVADEKDDKKAHGVKYLLDKDLKIALFDDEIPFPMTLPILDNYNEFTAYIPVQGGKKWMHGMFKTVFNRKRQQDGVVVYTEKELKERAVRLSSTSVSALPSLAEATKKRRLPPSSAPSAASTEAPALANE